MACRLHELRKSAGLVLIMSMLSLVLYGQDTTRVKASPYELLSSYYNSGFRPFVKGAGYTGLAFSLEDRSLENTQRLLDKVIDGSTLRYNIELKGGYFLSDYVQVGANFNYMHDKFQGIRASDSDTINSNSISRLFTVVPFVKPYFPLTSNERLSFFVELGMGLGGGNTLVRDTKQLDLVDKSYTTEFVFTVGLTPGVTFFAMQNFAFEVSINVVGYTLRYEETTVNDSEVSSEIRHNVNLNLNLLSLKLGVAYYFNHN